MTRHAQFERMIGDARFLLAADSGVVVEFGSTVDRNLSAKVLRLRHALELRQLPGVIDLIPSFRSLLVQYDPENVDPFDLIDLIGHVLDETVDTAQTFRHWDIPVCYHEEFAPDLAEVAHRLDMTPGDFVALHSAQEFFVYFLGFLPGCALMGDLPPQLELPRRVEPRVRLPAGSVAVAMRLTIIYPLVSPGGWHLIGNCPLKLFHPDLVRPSLFAPGDRVRFVPICPQEHQDILAEQSGAGAYQAAQGYLR